MKNLTLLISFLILPLVADAQFVRVGIRAGVNAASASQNSISQIKSLIQTAGNEAKLESVTGYHAGILLQLGGPHFSVQPEVLYSQYGARVVSGSNLAELKTNVIEVPVLAKYTFGNQRARFFLNAGPFIDYSLNGTYKVDAEIGTFPVNIRQDIEFKATKDRIAYGFTGGAGLTWQIGPGNVLAEVRYSYALQSKVPPSIAVLGGTNLHAQLGMISMGYQIPLSRKKADRLLQVNSLQ